MVEARRSTETVEHYECGCLITCRQEDKGKLLHVWLCEKHAASPFGEWADKSVERLRWLFSEAHGGGYIVPSQEHAEELRRAAMGETGRPSE